MVEKDAFPPLFVVLKHLSEDAWGRVPIAIASSGILVLGPFSNSP